MNAAFRLPKIQGEYIHSIKRQTKSMGDKPILPGNSSYGSGSMLPQSVDKTHKWHKFSPASKSISSVEMDEKRRKDCVIIVTRSGVWQLVCKNLRIYLLQGFEEENKDNTLEIASLVVKLAPNTTEEVVEPHISIHAIAGTPTPNNMRLLGSINRVRVTILVNSGSNHNFLETMVAKRAKLSSVEIPKLTVEISNGDSVYSEGYCANIAFKIQVTHINSPFYLLQLGGCDMVLGIKCLETLGPINGILLTYI